MFALTEELLGEFKEILPGHLLLGKREHLKRDMNYQTRDKTNRNAGVSGSKCQGYEVD